MEFRAKDWSLQLCAVLARAAALAAFTPRDRPLTGDEPVYAALAQSLLIGHGLSRGGAPWAERSPGWPVVLAAIQSIVGLDMRAAVFVQGLFDGGTILLGAALAARLFASRRAGWAAFAMLAAWPPFIRESRFLQTEPLFTLMLMVLASAVVGFAMRPGPARGVAVGLAAAGTALVRPNGAVMCLALLLGGALVRRRGRMPVASFAALVLAFALGMAPWVVRNARDFHAFIPMTSSGGATFYMGTTPETMGRWDHVRWRSLHRRVIAADSARRGRQPNAIEQDRALMRAGFAEIQRHPALQARLWLLRLGRLLGVPQGGDSTALRAAFLLVILLVDALAIRAAWRAAAADRAGPGAMAMALLVTVALSALAQSVFYTNSRYFEPLRALLLVVAAGNFAPARSGPAARAG